MKHEVLGWVKNIGLFQSFDGLRCHFGTTRREDGPLLPGFSLVTATHQYMGSFFSGEGQFSQGTIDHPL